jgi:hypothetical protein
MVDYSLISILLFISVNLVPVDRQSFDLYLNSPEKAAKVKFSYKEADKNWEFSDESTADKLVFSVDKKANSITLITAGGTELVSLKYLLKITGKEKWYKIQKVQVISQEDQPQSPITILRMKNSFILKQERGYLEKFKEIKVQY